MEASDPITRFLAYISTHDRTYTLCEDNPHVRAEIRWVAGERQPTFRIVQEDDQEVSVYAPDDGMDHLASSVLPSKAAQALDHRLNEMDGVSFNSDVATASFTVALARSINREWVTDTERALSVTLVAPNEVTIEEDGYPLARVQANNWEKPGVTVRVSDDRLDSERVFPPVQGTFDVPDHAARMVWGFVSLL
jgi:hypothetical protein